MTMSRKERSVRSFVQWLRETPHHRARYTYGRDDIGKSFHLGGRCGQKSIAMSTFRSARPYFEVASNSDTRMFRPSNLGMQLILGQAPFRDYTEHQQEVIRLVLWIRTHKHDTLTHNGKSSSHTLKSNDGSNTTFVPDAVWFMAQRFIEKADGDAHRLYRPSPEGFKLLTGEIGFEPTGTV